MDSRSGYTSLNVAIADYLRKRFSPELAAQFADEAGVVANGRGGDDAAAAPPALERKWTSVVRLQRRVRELESAASRGVGSVRAAAAAASYAARAPCAASLAGHAAAVTCAAAGESVAATGDADGSVRLWDCASRKAIGSLSGHAAAVTSLAFDDASGALLSCAADGTAKVWRSAEAGAAGARTLRGHVGAAAAGCFAPAAAGAAAKFCVTVGKDTTVRVWRAADGAPARISRDAHGAGVALRAAAATYWPGAAGAAARSLVATAGGADARLHALAADGSLAPAAAPLAGHGRDVEAVAFAPLGAARALDPARHARRALADAAGARRVVVVATASRDATVRVWRVSLLADRGDERAAAGAPPAADCLASLGGHGSWVRAVAWHPCGRRLSTAADDRSVRVWDVSGGRSVAELVDAHRGFVTALALHASSRTLLSAGDDRLVKLWSCR